MSPLFPSLLLGILIWAEPKAFAKQPPGEVNVNREQHVVRSSIGVVIDLNSRAGKEQKIAMEMAVEDSVAHSATASLKLELHFRNCCGNPARTVSNVIELLNNKNVKAILGAMTLQEAGLIWEFNEASERIPIISLTNTAHEPQPGSFITMSYNTEVRMQCIASIVGLFGWQKVIAIYERRNGFSEDFDVPTQLSDSLQPFGSILEHRLAFPRLESMSEPEKYVEEKLMGFRSMKSSTATVFIVSQCSLDFAILLFKKAKEVGMMNKGYVWIISDDIATLLDSIDPSVIVNYMQGVIGFKEKFVDTDISFKTFESRFSRKYRTEYPEEEWSTPSIHALKAYDATMAIARAMQNVVEEDSSNELIKSILASNFKGLSGNICFENCSLVHNKPVFQIVNLIGRSYREIGLWSPQSEHDGTKIRRREVISLDSIFWPGGERKVPEGRGVLETPMRIGVPAMGAFKQFVNVTYDSYTKQTIITGFSIQVFEAAVKRLPYYLPYVLVPFYGSYDEMVAQVHNQTLDGAVGDTEIMANRFKIVDFTHPYMDSGLVMVVSVKPDIKKTGISVLKAFSLQMWIVMASMTMLTGFVIWFNEYVDNNPVFIGPFPRQIGAILWFSVTVLSFSQREPIKHNLSRLVLTTWLFVTVIVTACFTAAVNSIMSVPKLEASIDIDSLLGTNAVVGCNGNSFIVRYLTDVLEFKQENIKKIPSLDDYPIAFQTGDIKAAFFVVPHARIFLAQHCNRYTMTGSNYKLGGFGFVFNKGAKVSRDISEAILEITESGAINQLEKRMFYLNDCSSEEADQGGSDSPGLGIDPFYILFLISGGLLAITFLFSVCRLAVNHCWPIHGCIQKFLMGRGIYRWISMLLLHLCTNFGTRFFGQTNNRLNGSGNDSPRVQDLAAFNISI